MKSIYILTVEDELSSRSQLKLTTHCTTGTEVVEFPLGLEVGDKVLLALI